MKTHTRQIIALMGGYLLVVGIFCPIISMPMVGYVSFFSLMKYGSYAIAAVGASAISFGFRKQFKGLYISFIVGFGIISYYLINLCIYLDNTKKLKGLVLDGNVNIKREAAQKLFADLTQVQWGWAILFMGIFLMLTAAVVEGEKTHDNALL